MPDELLADAGSGHNLRATVYVQARSMLREDGPAELRPVGETAFANAVAAARTRAPYICAGIVGYADLKIGAAVRPVLEAHVQAAGGSSSSPGRFRGIRQIALWDADPTLANPAYETSESMLDSDAFRSGFAELAPLGLSFDAWILFHQIPRLTRLARDFPQTQIVLNHCGGVAGIGAYAGRRDEVFAAWSRALHELAACRNVWVKIGGLGSRLAGFGFAERERAPSSEELAEAWRPWARTAMELFGPERCMFESNFPMDKGSYSWVVGWNAFKRLAEDLSEDEKDDLCWRSAARFYLLPGRKLELTNQMDGRSGERNVGEAARVSA